MAVDQIASLLDARSLSRAGSRLQGIQVDL